MAEGSEPGPLGEHSVYFADGHFVPDDVDVFSGWIIDLGGTIANQRKNAKILLVNPMSPAHEAERKSLEYSKQLHPHVHLPAVMPYHWLATCRQMHRLVELGELKLSAPIFTHPDRSAGHRPLRAWVSINIHREEGETPETAQENVAALLEAGGAIVAERRAKADVLIVDEQSNFAKKVRDEKEKHGRSWQKIVERDWVASCWRNKKLAWRGVGKEVEDGNESMMEDEQRESKGPGRPTGKPRVEYTPQDDEFVCRWLAAYMRGASLGSRKTYNTMVDSSSQYPIAARHSGQSWHERVRKNLAVFHRKIERYMAAGIDESLKTKAEREDMRLDKRAREEEEGQAADQEQQQQQQQQQRTTGLAPDITSPTAASATGTSAPPERRGKRKLVESDDDSPPQSPAPAVPAESAAASVPAIHTANGTSTITGSPPRKKAREREQAHVPISSSAVDAALPSASHNNPAMVLPAAEPDSATATDRPDVARSNDVAGDTTMDTDVVDGELLGLVEERPKDSALLKEERQASVTEEQNRDEEAEGAESQDVGETQAILADFARMRQQRDPRTSDDPPLTQAQAGPSTPAQHHQKTHTNNTNTNNGNLSSGNTHSAIKSRHELLTERLLMSSQKRRRTLERQERKDQARRSSVVSQGGRGPEDTADTVYASTSFGSFAPRSRPRSSFASSVIAQPASPLNIHQQQQQQRTPSGPVSPAVPLTEVERHEKVQIGATLINNMKDQYRARIHALAEEFGKSSAEMMVWLNDNRGRIKFVPGSEEGYWENVRRELRKDVAL